MQLVDAKAVRVAEDGVRGRKGVAVAVAALAAYFAVLLLLGGVGAWERLLVPRGDAMFYDLRNVTTAWDCAARGVGARQLMVSNPCDPDLRPANYPRLWVVPSVVGLRSNATVPLGVAIAAVFLCSVLWLARRSSLRDGIVWALALISPTVMFGIERANVDLVVFAVVVAGVALLRRGTVMRVLAHVVLLAAALLKLFPALGFVVLVRQPGRWRSLGAGAVVAAFAAYCAITARDIRTFVPAVPQEHLYSFGAGVFGDALDIRHPYRLALAGVAAGACAALVLALRRRHTWETPTAARSGNEASDAFVVGAAIYTGTFAVFQSWDYRLVFLLLTIPQLLGWARDPRHSAAPLPRLTLVGVVAALWLGAFFSRGWTERTPWDEAVNWFLFVSLLAALVGLLAPALRRLRPTW